MSMTQSLHDGGIDERAGLFVGEWRESMLFMLHLIVSPNEIESLNLSSTRNQAMKVSTWTSRIFLVLALFTIVITMVWPGFAPSAFQLTGALEQIHLQSGSGMMPKYQIARCYPTEPDPSPSPTAPKPSPKPSPKPRRSPKPSPTPKFQFASVIAV